ncbi:dynein heavy chain 2, axonemal [Trichonephila clavipes]|nr:dynein heavy chain 2, axonemal [Trichonephila clavipes]
MGVIMKRDANMEDSGPLEEMEFWELKCADLEKVLVQLQRDDVKMCIKILKTAQLASYFKFMEVSNQLQNEFDLAQSNVKFLSILKTPCGNIELSSLDEIPEHLSGLLDLVRIIWNNSPYFKKQNRVSNLLCESEKVHKKFASDLWSVKDISPQINLFIHRCEELIQICELKDELSFDVVMTYSPGQKCFEVAEQFKATEKRFWNLLQELGKNKYVALQMRSSVWHEFFRKFKIEINELEISISKLMLNSFENLNTVEEGIQILKMFQKHFEKQEHIKDPVGTALHIQEANMDDTTQAKTHTERTAAGYMTTEKQAKRERFPETSVFIPDVEDHVTFL